MTCKSLAFATMFGIFAAAGASAHADSAADKVSGALVDGYEGLRDGMLDSYEIARKGTVEKWQDLTARTGAGTQGQVAQGQASILTADIQRGLIAAGYAPGPVDGRNGPATGTAIRAYQRNNGLAQDGQTSQALLDRLQGRQTSATGTQSASTPPAPAARSEDDCSKEWNFADLDHDGVIQGDEASIYFEDIAPHRHRAISRPDFIRSCRDRTLDHSAN